MSADVVVVGGINMDLTAWVDRLALPGETVRGDRLLQHPGGKGANQVVAAARAGASTALIGRVGDDVFGAELLEGLLADGVDCSGIVRDPAAPTGVALIVVDAAGQNTVTVATGANGRVSITDLERADSLLSSARVGVLNFEIPLETAFAAAQWFHRAGSQVLLNLSPLFAPPDGLLDLVDVLVVNELEGAVVAGQDCDPETTIALIRERGIKQVVLTLGASGVAFNRGEQIVRIPGHVIKVADPTGAGDAFLGTLAAELAAGTEIHEACRLANGAGALAAACDGAQISMPQRSAVRRFLEDGVTTDG